MLLFHSFFIEKWVSDSSETTKKSYSKKKFPATIPTIPCCPDTKTHTHSCTECNLQFAVLHSLRFSCWLQCSMIWGVKRTTRAAAVAENTKVVASFDRLREYNINILKTRISNSDVLIKIGDNQFEAGIMSVLLFSALFSSDIYT